MKIFKSILSLLLVLIISSCNVAISSSSSLTSSQSTSTQSLTNVTSIELSSTSSLNQFIGLTSMVTVSARLNQSASQNTPIEWFVDDIKSITQTGLVFEFFPNQVKTYSIQAKSGNVASNVISITVGLPKFSINNIQALTNNQISIRGDSGISFTIPGLSISTSSNYNLANQTYILNLLTPMIQGTTYSVTANKAGFDSVTVPFTYETRRLSVGNIFYRGLKLVPNADGAYEIQKPFAGAPSQNYTLSLIQTNLEGTNVPISIITNVPAGATPVAPYQTTISIQKGVNITKDYTLTTSTEPGLYVHNVSVNNVNLVVRVLVSNPVAELVLSTPVIFDAAATSTGGTPMSNPFAVDAEGELVKKDIKVNSAGQYVVTRPYNGRPFELTFTLTANNFSTPLGFPQGSNPYNIIAALSGPSGGVMYYRSTVNTLTTTFPFRETTGNSYRVSQYIDSKTALGTYNYNFTATGFNLNITRNIVIVVKELAPEITPIIEYNGEELDANSDGSFTIIKPLGSNTLDMSIAAKISNYESPLASGFTGGSGTTTLYNTNGLRYLLDTRITYSGPLSSITPLVTKLAIELDAESASTGTAVSQTNPTVNYTLYYGEGATREIDLLALRDAVTYTASNNIFDNLKTISALTFPGIHTYTVQIGALSKSFIFRVIEASPAINLNDESIKYGPETAESEENVTFKKEDGKYYVDGKGKFIKIDVLPFGMPTGEYPYTFTKLTPSGSFQSSSNNVNLTLKSGEDYDGTLTFPDSPSAGYEMEVNELLSEEGEYVYSFTINNIFREIRIVVLASPQLKVDSVTLNELPLERFNNIYYINHSTSARYIEFVLTPINIENTYKYIMNKTGEFPTGSALTSELKDLVIVDGKMIIGVNLPARAGGSVSAQETHTYLIAVYKGTVQIGTITRVVIISQPVSTTVFFNTNGGTPIVPLTQFVGSKIASLSSTRAGYGSLTWHTTPLLNSAVTIGTASGDYSIPEADATLFAKWVPNNNTVVFNANYPDETGTESGSMANQTIATDAAAALRTNAFAKVGFVFTEWNTAADGSGTSFLDEASYTMGPLTSYTLYAQWEEEE